MTRIAKPLLALLLLGLAASAFAQANVDTLIGNLSSDDANVRLSSARELGTLGPAPLARLLQLVAGEDQRVAAGARLAVQALTQNLVAPGAPAGREEAAKTLLDVAGGKGSPDMRRFALRQLALIGTDASVPRLVALLADPDMGEMARFALARIPGQTALEALIAAARTPDPRLRIGVLNALGDRGDPSAAKALIAAASDADASVRMAAVQALGHIPSTEGMAVIWEATGRGDEAERQAGRDAYLRLAETLLGAGQTAEARDMFERAHSEFALPRDKCAALAGWAKAAGKGGVSRLIEAVRTAPRDEAGVAKQALVVLRGADVTDAVAKATADGSPEARVALLWVLGMRGDKTAVPALVAALKAPEDEVKTAALEALSKLQDASSVEPIIQVLVEGPEATRGAAEAALGRIPGREAADALAAAIKTAPPEARLPLVRVLGLHAPRGSDAALIEAATDPSEDVRMAAVEALGRHQSPEAVPTLIKAATSDSKREADAVSAALTGMTKPRATDAILAALPTIGPKERAAVLRALGARADESLTDLFVKSTKDKDEGVVVAALDGLGRLHDAKTSSTVVNLAKTGTAPEKAAAVRAYLEIGKASVETDRAGALRIFHEALGLAEQDGERSLALAAIGSLGSPESLPLVRPLLQQGSDQVKKAAAGALVSIAEALVNEGRTTEAQELITSSLGLLDDRDLLRRAASAMRAMGKPLPLAAQKGYLTEFWVLGPAGARDDLRKGDVVPTNARIDVEKPVAIGDQRRTWQYRPVDDPVGHLDFEKAVGRLDNVGAYAYVEFDAPAAQDALLKVGSDDDVYCWLNGQKVFEFVGNRGWTADQDTADVSLKAGTNWLLCKVLNGGAQWALSARLTDREGRPLQVKQWTKTPADIAAQRGCVASFWVLGPFAGREAMRTASPVEPNAPIDLARPVTQGDETRFWHWVSVTDTSGMLDLRQVVGDKQDVGCYLYAEVTSDKAQDVLLKIGSDDDVYVWLNGELVLENPVARPWAEDQDTVQAHFDQGPNRILLKVLQGGGDWAASVRITDPQGNPLVLPQRKP